MKLEILISTYGPEGMRRMARPGALPQADGVGYLISWQRGGCDENVPQPLLRTDIRIVIAAGRGLGANRANCLIHARGEWCLIADDDLVFDIDAIKRLLQKVDATPGLDFVLARSSGPDNKIFPLEEYPVFPLRRRHFVTEFEMLVNLGAVRRANINYNPNFGAGSKVYTAGEGAVFMYEMRRKGLKGRYFPITIVEHPGLTTSERIAMDCGVLKSVGVAVALDYPFTGVLRIPLVGYRRWRRFGGSLPRAILELYQGFIAGLLRKSALAIAQ